MLSWQRGLRTQHSTRATGGPCPQGCVHGPSSVGQTSARLEGWEGLGEGRCWGAAPAPSVVGQAGCQVRRWGLPLGTWELT